MGSIQRKIREVQAAVNAKHQALSTLQEHCSLLTNHEAYVQELTSSILELADKLESLDSAMNQRVLQHAEEQLHKHKATRQAQLQLEQASLQ